MNSVIANTHSPLSAAQYKAALYKAAEKAAQYKAIQAARYSQAIERAQARLLYNHHAQDSTAPTYLFFRELVLRTAQLSGFKRSTVSAAIMEEVKAPASCFQLARATGRNPFVIGLTDDMVDYLTYIVDETYASSAGLREHFAEYKFDGDELFVANASNMWRKECNHRPLHSAARHRRAVPGGDPGGSGDRLCGYGARRSWHAR